MNRPALILAAGFQTRMIATPDGASLFVRHGKAGLYLDRFWNEFAGDPSKIDEATRAYHTRQYAQPGAMRASFNRILSQTKLPMPMPMPVLATGGEKSFGATMAVVMRNAATNVREAVVLQAGHWLMEEGPDALVARVGKFLGSGRQAAPR